MPKKKELGQALTKIIEQIDNLKKDVKKDE